MLGAITRSDKENCNMRKAREFWTIPAAYLVGLIQGGGGGGGEGRKEEVVISRNLAFQNVWV